MSRSKALQFETAESGLFFLMLMALLIIAASHVALAQVTASISGRIEDPSGAALPGANVTVTSLETGAVRTVPSDEGGNYRALSLPVGRYEVKAERTGFQTEIQTGITLVVGQQAVVNLSMRVGQVQEQVTVTGEAPVVNTTTASVSGLVGEKEVKELPLNGRSFDQLITLNAGTVNFTTLRATGSGTSGGNRFTVSGRRPTENYFLLNGVELTGPTQDTAVPWGASGQLLGVDAIREFNVVTDAYGAEYGKRAGAQVSIVTQSGTNQLHGSMFEFLRNSVLDARNFFDKATIPPFKRNQFGGAAGGPIKKDKTFLFGNYEGLRYRLGTSSVALVPDANARRGLLPDPVTGVPTPVPGLQPGMLPYMAYWPEPNGPNLGGGVAVAYASPAESIREEYGTVRLDHTFSGEDTLSGNYTIDDGAHINPLQDPLFADNILLRYQLLSLQETHVFSPSTINVFTAGVARAGFSYSSPPITPLPASISFFPGRLPGLLTVGGGSGVGGSISTLVPAGPTTGNFVIDYRTIFTYTDQVQVIKGSHQISVGAWFQRLRDNGFNPASSLARVSFSNLQSFLQGTSLQIQAAQFGGTTNQWRQFLGAWYVQDSVQLRPNLNLRIGVRHEFTNGWNDPTGRASNFVYSNGVIQTNPLIGNSSLTENNARWLFSPRVGVAWDPFGKGKTSIRAAFGTYYDLQDVFTGNLGGRAPFDAVATFTNAAFLSVIPIDTAALSRRAVCGPGIPQPCVTYQPRGFPPTFKTPTVEEWNFSVEQQITPNMSFRASYLGSEGYHEVVIMDPNTIRPQICSDAAGCVSGGINAVRGFAPQGKTYVPVGTRPNPFMANGQFYWNFEGTSSYNALQVELKKRFSRNLEFKGNYTWSKNMAEGENGGLGQSKNTTDIMTPYNVGLNRGPAPMDFTHQVSISGSYELPFGNGKTWLGGVSGVADKLAGGWQFNWIVSAVSGYPLIPTIGANVSGNGDLQPPDRPSWNPTFTGKVVTGNPRQWFDPHAFIVPTSGTFGNVGVGVIRSGGLGDLDLSLFKNTALTERLKLQFRAEFFNVLNRANFGFPSQVVFSGGQFTANPTFNPTAGFITATTTSSRQIQFGLKLNF
jgi:carboxypeptidase family protein